MGKQPENIQAKSSPDKKSDPLELPPETDKRFAVGIKKPSKRKKRLIVGLVLILIAFVLGVGYLVFGRDSEGDPINAAQVETMNPFNVELIDGVAEISRDGGQSWSVLTLDQTLSTGDQVRTGEDNLNRVSFAYADDSHLRLDEGSVISVDSNTEADLRISLRSGRLYARLSNLGDTKVYIATGGQTVEAIGTAFGVSAIGESLISVYEGSVLETISGKSLAVGKELVSGGDPAAIDTLVIKADAFIIWNRDQDISHGFAEALGVLEDIESPDLSITTPVNGAQIQIPDGSNSAGIDIVGSTESGANVRVSSSDGVTAEVTADETGAFKVTMSGTEGSVTYTITSTDRSSNISKLTLRVDLVPEVVEVSTPDITLGAIAEENTGVTLNWNFRTGFDAPDGIKVLWNQSGNLTYPVETVFIAPGSSGLGSIRLAQASQCDKDKSFGDKQAGAGTSSTVCVRDGKSYAFRVCRYDTAADTCDIYSNEVRVTAPGKE